MISGETVRVVLFDVVLKVEALSPSLHVADWLRSQMLDPDHLGSVNPNSVPYVCMILGKVLNPFVCQCPCA